jgi:hypothetical protein
VGAQDAIKELAAETTGEGASDHHGSIRTLGGEAIIEPVKQLRLGEWPVDLVN